MSDERLPESSANEQTPMAGTRRWGGTQWSADRSTKPSTPVRRNRGVLVFGGVLTVLMVVAGGLAVTGAFDQTSAEPKGGADSALADRSGKAVEQLAVRFLMAMSRGDVGAAAAMTDQPEAAARDLTAVREWLTPRTQANHVKTVNGDEVSFTTTWGLRSGTWSYESRLTVVDADSAKRIRWSRAVIHPELTPDSRLRVSESAGTVVLDSAGAPIEHAENIRDSVRRVRGDGAASFQVFLVAADNTDLKPLYESGPPGEPIRTTIEAATQRSAAQAVEASANPAAIVALRGDHIVALAQDSRLPANAALNGKYPPGSTFKIVTTAAALRDGSVGPDTIVACPGEGRIGGRSVRNDGFALGEVPLRTAFARSCNTSFASLGEAMEPAALSEAAQRLGLTSDYVIEGVTTRAGSIGDLTNPTARVEASFGQGTVEVSPFGMAIVAGTLANGAVPTPMIIADTRTTVDIPRPPLRPAEINALRAMTRAVVTSGTASSLASIPGLHGKTGTAEREGGAAHGWFVGFQGDLAFAVFVEGGGSSAEALAVTKRFLTGLR